jgi:hypothetical protein
MAGYIGSRTNNALVSLSGANGTIGDNVVFPAGHIIQTFHRTYQIENSVNYNGTTAITVKSDGTISGSSTEEFYVDASNITSGNKIFLMFTFCYSVYGSGVDAAFGSFGICRDSLTVDGNGDPTNDLVINQTANNIVGVNQNAGSNIQQNNMLTLTAFDTPTGASHSYKLTYQSAHSNYYLKVRPQAINNFFAFEIQQ